MAEPAPTRRSSRRRNADSATTSGVEATSPVEAEVSAVLGIALGDSALLSAAVPQISRRAARERDRAAAEARSAALNDDAKRAAAAEAVAESPAEPVDEPDAHAEPVAVDGEPAAEDEASADAFEEACRAFRSFAADAPEESPAAAFMPAEEALPAEATTVHVARRRRRSSSKFLAVGATVGVMGIAGMLAISMTLPAEAVAAAQGTKATTAMSLVTQAQGPASESVEDEIQAFVAPSDVQNDVIQRAEDFSTASLIDLAAERGIDFSSALYTNDPDAAIQWPFVVGVGMSSGYGSRNGRMHEGIDLVPGAGAPIQSIADGTVRIATESGGNYGVTAYIDHVVDGKVVTSHYSHMQYGSLRVVSGQKVEVGDIIGNVGNTGRSYGAHLHFELIVDGTKIDPLPWMQKNAGRYEH